MVGDGALLTFSNYRAYITNTAKLLGSPPEPHVEP